MSKFESERTPNLRAKRRERWPEVVRRFAASWRAGERPKIESHLEGLPDEDRTLAMGGMLDVEFCERIRRGEAIDREEYVRRFSDQATVVEAAIELLGREPVTKSLREADRSTADGLRPRVEDPAPPAAFADYEILGEIARGGMGVVYKARQRRLGRLVALKMTLAGRFAHPEERRRFLAEAEAAGKLDHPNIVPVFDVGERDGQLYYSMAFVDGRSLRDELTGGPLEPHHAAELTATVAEAVEYAHRQGIVHRDLKPANILLDADGRPRVTDFGLAKSLGEDSELTCTGQILGTPSYMSPEQARGDTRSVGRPADVYALGATLYHLLAGRPPFQAATPSATVAQVLADEPVPLRRLNVGVPRDLETICLRCLHKAPDRRYAGAGDVAADLGRFLKGEPIVARPASSAEKTWRWCRRNPRVAALATAVALLLVGIACVSVVGYWSTSQALEIAEREQDESERRRIETQATVVKLDSELGLMSAERGDPSAATLWFAQAVAAAEENPESRRPNLTRFWSYGRTAPLPFAASMTAESKQVGRSEPGLVDLAFAPAGGALLIGAVMSPTPTYDLFDLRTESRPAEWGDVLPSRAAAWNPDGTRLAVVVGEDGIEVREFPSARLVSRFASGGPVRHLAFSPDGGRLAVTGGRCLIWNCESKAVEFDPVLVRGTRAFWNGSSDRVAFAGDDEKLYIYDVTTNAMSPTFDPIPHQWRERPLFLAKGERLLTVYGQKAELRALDDARTIASFPCSGDSRHSDFDASLEGEIFATNLGSWEVSVYDARQGGLRNGGLRHSNTVLDIAVSADERILMTGSGNRSATIGEIDGGLAESGQIQHLNEVVALAFSPEGGVAATLQIDGLLRVWLLPAAMEARSVAGRHIQRPDPGKSLAVRGLPTLSRTLTFTDVIDLEKGTRIGPQLPLRGLLNDAEFSHDGRIIVTLSTQADRRDRVSWQTWKSKSAPGWIELWDWPAGQPRSFPLASPSEPISVARHPRESLFAVTCAAGEVLLLDAQSGRLISEARHPGAPTDGLAKQRVHFAPDGARFVTSLMGDAIVVWDSESGAKLQTIRTAGAIYASAMSPDGRHFATASPNDVQVFDLLSGDEVAPVLRHPDWIHSISFCADGRTLLTSCRDSSARIWTWRSGELVGAPMHHDDEVFAAEELPGADELATVGRDGSIGFWDAKTGRPIAPSAVSPHRLSAAAVTPQGTRLLASGDASVWIDLDDILGRRFPTLPPDRLRSIGELIAGRRVNDGGLVNLTSDEWFERWQGTDKREWLVGVELEKKARLTSGTGSEEKDVDVTEGFERSRELWTELIERGPPSPYAHFARSEINFHLRDFEAANVDLDEADRLGAEESELLGLRVAILAEQGQDAAASAEYARLIALPDIDERRLLHVVDQGVRLAHFGAAAEALNRALHSDPTDDRGWFGRAALLAEAGEGEELRRHCRAMLDRFEKDPTAPPARRTAFCCSLFAIDVDCAVRVETLAKAAAIGAADAWRPLELAAAAYRRGNFEKTLEELGDVSSAESRGEHRVLATLLTAAANYGIGRRTEAEARLAEAIAEGEPWLASRQPTLVGPWHLQLACRALHREIAALIRGPAFSPTFQEDGTALVGLEGHAPGAVVRFTLDDSQPTGASSAYSRPILVKDGGVLKARVFYARGTTSATASWKNDDSAGWHGWPRRAPPPAIAPFDAEVAERHQWQWAEFLNVPDRETSAAGFGMRLIPPGQFLMGPEPQIASKSAGAHPQREVELSHAFYLSACEITQSEFERVTSRNPSKFAEAPDASLLPVDSVSWFDALEFCNLLSDLEDLTPAYHLSDIERTQNGQIAKAIVREQNGASGYRLPTEAQWEYAYRAGTRSRCYFDARNADEALKNARLADSGSPSGPISVGSLSPNAWGIHDMEGNLSEWCLEAYDSRSPSNVSSLDPRGSLLGDVHCLRGSGWACRLGDCGAAVRRSREESDQGHGFRVLRLLPKVARERSDADPSKL